MMIWRAGWKRLTLAMEKYLKSGVLNKAESYKGYLKMISPVLIAGIILSACGSDTTRDVSTTNTQQPFKTMTPLPTGTPVPTETKASVEVKHPEFSRKYQPEYIDHHEVVVDGIKMNIDWGLSHWVIARPEKPVSEIHIAPDIAQILGEIYMESYWYRFTHFMPGNESVSYEQYVELVKQGKGDISFAGYDEVNGGLRPVEIMIDPAEGFAVSLVDESLPIKINTLYSMYYGSDGTGRLFVAAKLDASFIKRYEHDYGSMCDGCTEGAIFNSLYQKSIGDIVTLENKCLLYENVLSTCGLVSRPPEWLSIIQKETEEEMKFINGTRGWMFEMVEK